MPGGWSVDGQCNEGLVLPTGSSPNSWVFGVLRPCQCNVGLVLPLGDSWLWIELIHSRVLGVLRLSSGVKDLRPCQCNEGLVPPRSNSWL